MTWMTIVSREYDGNFERDSVIRSALEPYGLVDAGAGTGFGMRDLEFESETPPDLRVLSPVLKQRFPEIMFAIRISEIEEDA